MTEDHLTQLLAEATDLAPSAALRERVVPSPQPLSPGGGRGLGRIPWLALSGATAALAAATFLAMPRTVSAAELIRQADQAVRNALTYRIECEIFAKGAWQTSVSGLHAPRWQLERWPNGSFRLQRPGTLYRRDVPGPILMTHRFKPDPMNERLANDPSPEAYVRAIESPSPGSVPQDAVLALGEVIDEGGRRLREVTISQKSHSDLRLRFLIDEPTNLPTRLEVERRRPEGWRTEARTRFTYPGPTAGSEPFTRPLHSAPIVDVDAKESKRSIG